MPECPGCGQKTHLAGKQNECRCDPTEELQDELAAKDAEIAQLRLNAGALTLTGCPDVLRDESPADLRLQVKALVATIENDGRCYRELQQQLKAKDAEIAEVQQESIERGDRLVAAASKIVDLRNEIAAVKAERDRMKEALEEIVSWEGECIFSLNADYREGTNDAFIRCADRAKEALPVRTSKEQQEAE